MLVESDRWGEEKGQCGESERERERETDGSRKNLAGHSRESGKPKNVSRRRTQREGRQSSEGQGGNDRKRLNIPPVRTGLTGTRLNSTLGQSGNING